MHGGIHPDTAPDSIEDISKQVARELRNFDDYSRHLVSRGIILPFFTLQEISTRAGRGAGDRGGADRGEER